MHKRTLIRYCILLLAITASLIPVIWIEYDVWQHTHGTLTFPTDNAFTDMAVAENLGFHQVWGMSKHSFDPAGSSLLYIALLAIIFFVIGAHTIIPLVVNIVAGVWFLVVFQRWLISQGIRPGYQLLIMLLVIYGIPLPLLVVSGMGYMLQLLFGFLFVVSLRQLGSEPVPRKIYIYALLMVAANVENIILLAVACGLLIGQRRWKLIRRDYIRIAILYDKKPDTNPLSNWNNIASWQIHSKDGVKKDSVSFYAFAKNSSLQADLRKNLRDYQFRLPAEVNVRYY